jgi:pSer/pThr/pTyr-binding forkhead associated (FHA) protein
VEDLNSANGLYVNGKRVAEAELKAKDRMVVGDFILEVTVK